MQLIKKPVWAVSDEVLEVLDILKVRDMGGLEHHLSP